MSSDEVADQALLILTDAINGDMDSALRRFQAVSPTPADGFAACCAMANVIAVAGKLASDPDAKGPLLVEMSTVPGADPAEVKRFETVASDVAAFIAGVGNNDYRGAQIVFEEATCREVGPRGPTFMVTLLKMAAACAMAVEDEP